jgi:hypothetical protein
MRRHMPDREDNPDPGQADTPQKFSCPKTENAASFGDVAIKKCLTQSPRLDNASVADEGHGAGACFAIFGITNKRPFVNECKGVLCGTAHQKPLRLHRLSAIREFWQTVPRACNIRSAGAFRQNPWVKSKNPVFCTYEASSACLS